MYEKDFARRLSIHWCDLATSEIVEAVGPENIEGSGLCDASDLACANAAAVRGAELLVAAESRATAAERDLTAIEAALDEAGTGNYSKATPEYLRSIPMLAKRVRILAHARDSHSKAFDASHAQLTRMGTEVSAACGFECIPAVRVTDVDVVVDGVRRTVAKLREDATAAERERDEARARVERADEAAMGALARSQAAHDVMTRAGVGGVGGYVKDRVALLISDRDSIRAKLGEAEKDREDWREQAIGNGKAYHAANAKLTRYAALESAAQTIANEIQGGRIGVLGSVPSGAAEVSKAFIRTFLDALSAPAPGAADGERKCNDCGAMTINGLCGDTMSTKYATPVVHTTACKHFIAPAAPKPETCGECQSHGQRECPADTVRAESDPACDKATRRLPVVARGCITCLHNATGSQTCCDCDESDSGWQPRPAAQGVENG